jgi:hypothetical protein
MLQFRVAPATCSLCRSLRVTVGVASDEETPR